MHRRLAPPRLLGSQRRSTLPPGAGSHHHNTAELIVQPSSRQYPGTLPVARYQDLSWAAMHNNRFHWLEWCALLAMTLAYRSLSNACFFPPLSSSLSLSLSPVTRPLIQQSMLLILIAPLLLPRGEKRRNQGQSESNHSSEVKTAIMASMDRWKMTKHATCSRDFMSDHNCKLFWACIQRASLKCLKRRHVFMTE